MTDTPRETILADIRNRLAAFTLGPLDANDRGDGSGSLYRRDASDYEILDDPLCRPLRGAARLVDCQFFACAADDIRTLLAECDTLRAQLAEREGEIATLRADVAQWTCNSRENKQIAKENSHRADTAEAQLRAQGWQPIETAPQGEDVIVGGGDCPRVHVNRMSRFNTASVWWGGLGDKQQPTYWMSLPAPPITKESQPHE